MVRVDVNGSWIVGVCRDPRCGEVHMMRSGTNVPTFRREWCESCRSYTVTWSWIRVANAVTTDGD